MSPIATESITVPMSPRCGSSSVNGSTPRIETQITYLRPIRSPIGPPAKVPAATAARNTNSSTCDVCTDTSKVWIR